MDVLADRGLIEVVIEPDVTEVLFWFQQTYAIHSLTLVLGCTVSDIPRGDLDKWLSAIRAYEKSGGSVFELPFKIDTWVTSATGGIHSGKTSHLEHQPRPSDFQRRLLSIAG